MTKRTVTLSASEALRAGYSPTVPVENLQRFGFAGDPDDREAVALFLEGHPVLNVGFGVEVDVEVPAAEESA